MKELRFFDYAFLSLAFCTITFPLTNSPLGWTGPAAVWTVTFVAILAFINRRGSSLLKDALGGFWFKAMMVLLLVEILMIPIHGADPQARYVAGRLTMLALAFVTVLFLARTGLVGFRLLQKALVYSAVLLVVVMVAQAAGVFSLGNETEQGRLYFGIRLPVRKVTGFLMSDGRLGTILAPAFLMAIGPIFAQKSKYFAIIKYRPLIALVLLAGIVLTQSRSAYAATLLGFAIYGVFVFRSRFYRIACLLLILVATNEYGQSAVGGFQSEGRLQLNVVNRFYAFEDAILNWQSAPLIGVGHQNMMVIRDLEGKDMFVHNMFFDQIGSLGLLGFIPLALPFLYLLFNLSTGLRGRGKGGELPVRALFLAILIAILVELNLYRGFYNEYSILYSVMALALILYLRRSSKHEHLTRHAKPGRADRAIFKNVAKSRSLAYNVAAREVEPALRKRRSRGSAPGDGNPHAAK